MKLNRIGYKLGLAGAVGILLAGGMVANQMMSERAIEAANSRADRSQRVIDAAISANLNGRQIELAARNIRLATKAADVERNAADLSRLKATQTKALDDALAIAALPDTKQRLEKIRSLMNSYTTGVDELAKTQLNLLAVIDKRSAISAEWTKAIETQLASPALAKLDNKLEIEKLLHMADAKVNTLRAMVWRLGATGDVSLIAQIAKTQAALKANFNLLRGEADDRDLLVVVSSLDSIVKRFLAANDEAVKTEELKVDIVVNRSVKFAQEAGTQMDSLVDVARKDYATSKEEAAAETERASMVSLAMGIVVIIALFASMVFSFLGISRPMMRLNGALGEMAGGNLDVVIPGARRGDEIGDLAKTVTIIRENAEQKARDEAEAKIKQDQIAARQRKDDMIKLADTFETAVGEIVETVSSASNELEASAGTLTSNAERAQELTTMVAAASEEASTNVQSVASATEELSSSVNEISRQVQESARMATAAVEQARTTNDRVSQLSKAASRIGDVVELINTIAEQTNLLALNATIEAARAGDAGRGFAVVASEVKALAEQTSKATGEIGQQISGIQAATQDSVNAIKEISGTIEKLSEISSTIAAAVEEQGAATQEISRNVQQAAHGTQQVSSNITDVQRGASETGSASTQVLSAAQSLSGDSNRLKQEVGKFLDSVRAA
ncbi:HAMP domain-containing protein [Bradyrhizobium sp. AUGA SZCCT0240]|uniref:methyl-accepting chemotaxis protein n=1 Tax=unclassified Bradyrhizobium TaxID=2631580 RepID=UPI001BADB787|nr:MULTISPECIES: methyl-accepting chemotaxis protein [unclassified Bradyrhizobium]MBR1198090.1 HAMP domain-containing protein [Bradyrhizobium sp. AUGA SZCCT0158]MBR1243454.1 HAMP domain-containing protein [Bradyrhizobium sp. AUGA SZCCT0274]MBR1253272.1 HAMP domain-containing protein [Bradyrhizobium sp. AUGA SZCCT0240]